MLLSEILKFPRFFLEVLSVGLSKHLILEMSCVMNTRSSHLKDVDEQHWNRLLRGWIFIDDSLRAAGWMKLCLTSWSGYDRAPSSRMLDQSTPEVPAVTTPKSEQPSSATSTKTRFSHVQ